jgi:hypothetical protein
MVLKVPLLTESMKKYLGLISLIIALYALAIEPPKLNSKALLIRGLSIDAGDRAEDNDSVVWEMMILNGIYYDKKIVNVDGFLRFRDSAASKFQLFVDADSAKYDRSFRGISLDNEEMKRVMGRLSAPDDIGNEFNGAYVRLTGRYDGSAHSLREFTSFNFVDGAPGARPFHHGTEVLVDPNSQNPSSIESQERKQ